MTDNTRDVLIRQFDIAWELARYHLRGITTEECLWRPASVGPHVKHQADGSWRGEWPEHEDYSLGPPSIGWIAWHMGFWWSMVIDHSFGDASLRPDEVTCPGDADLVRDWIEDLAARWRRSLEDLQPDELLSSERSRWPFGARPFADVVAWATVELTKNAAELGYVRFLYAVQRAEDV